MGRRLGFDPGDALDAAMRVFWEMGYEGASLDDLTHAMGINKPSLYRSFGNKQHLFQLVLRHYETQNLGFFWKALRHGTAKAVVVDIMRGYLRLATNHATPVGCLGINAAVACSLDAEPVRTLLLERRLVYLEKLKERFAQAKAEGDLAAHIDPASFANLIMMLIAGSALQAKAGIAPTDLTQAIDLAVNAVF